MKRNTLCISICLIVLVAFTSCTDPGYPPTLSAPDAAHLFSAIRDGIDGQKPALPSIKAKGFIISAYDGNGSVSSYGDEDLTNLMSTIHNNFSSSKYERSFLTLNIINQISKTYIDFLQDIPLFSQNGLYGVMRVKNGAALAIDPIYMATRGLDFDGAVKRLSEGKGTPVAQIDLGDGVYKFTCESYTEPKPGADPVPLFRANVLFEKVTPEIIAESIRIGGDMLVRLQGSSGRFAYTYNPATNRRSKNSYNLLRHAGSCYALLQLYGETGDEKYLKAGMKGLAWLEDNIQIPAWDKKRAYPVYHNRAKLGGAALSLLAMCEAVKVNPEFVVTPTMHKLAYHLRREQNADGNFNSYYSWNQKPVKKRFSIYYPGEAMLALARYQQLVPESTESIQVCEKAARFLINKRWRIVGMEINVPPDAWLMMALHELWKADPKDEYVDYCLRIADVMASDQHVKWVPHVDYFGGYFPDPPQVTPAGSRLEGLTGAYQLAKAAGRKTDWIKSTIERGATFEIRMQIRPSFAHLFPNPKMALGTFRHSPVKSFNRIDYNQHNISGLIVARKILMGEI